MHSWMTDEARGVSRREGKGWRRSSLRAVAVLGLLGLAGPASAIPERGTQGDCPQGYLCVYSGRLGADVWAVFSDKPYMLAFQRCEDVFLAGKPFPGGGMWNDKVSAIVNNRAAGSEAHFYDYSGSGTDWIYLKTVGAGDYLLDLSKDKANDGGPMNDRIDAIRVCGEDPSNFGQPVEGFGPAK